MENKQSSGSAAPLSSLPGRSDLVEVTNRPRTNETGYTVADGKRMFSGAFVVSFVASGACFMAIVSTSTQSADQKTLEPSGSRLPAAQDHSRPATTSFAASSPGPGATDMGDGNHCVPLSQPIIRRHLDGSQSDANARRSVPWTTVARYHHPTNGHGLWSYETGGARRTRAISIGGGRPTSLPASQVEVYVEMWEEGK